jgi:hypothetical protein
MIGLMPTPITYPRAAPTSSYIGQNYNPNDGFPTGAQTFTAGQKIIVIACQLAGAPAASGVTVGGVACTQACAITSNGQSSIWYLATTASGSLTISGTGGSGRSILHAYELRGYSSSTPYSTATGSAVTASSCPVSLPTSSNTITVAAGMMGPVGVTLTASTGPALSSVINVAVESTTTHYSFVQRPTSRGNPTVYTATGASATTYGMALAAWR